jgi:hypothetical protein
MITRIARWEIDHDPVMTAHCYALDVNYSPCECIACRNFRAVGIDRAFPEPFRDLAQKLGIDLSKPAELAHIGCEPGTPCRSGGWFHLVGSVRSGRDFWRQANATAWLADGEACPGLSGFGFTERIALLPDSFKGRPVVQLEFETIVPWVLKE